MEPGLKQRLVGASIFVILAVIFIPMLLDTSVDDKQVMSESNIPPQPADMPVAPAAEEFNSRIVPLEQMPEPEPEPAGTGSADATATPGTETTAPAPDGAVPAPPGQSVPVEEARTPVMENEGANGSVGVTAWVVQLGSFADPEKAEALNQKLRKAGFKSFVEPLRQNDSALYRVRIGPELKRSDAESISARLKKNLQMDGIVVRYP